MKRTIGVFAHVDAGKTTFCEALLYGTHQLPAPGRVDHQSSLMDHDTLEKRRGITIFSDVASFSYAGCRFTLIDTPGHIDFSAEMERALAVLDGAVLLVSAVDGVQSHTLTVFRLLRERRVPVYLFLNKTDHVGADVERCMRDIRGKLTPACYFLPQPQELATEGFGEWLCGYSDELLERYLYQALDREVVLRTLGQLIGSGDVVLTQAGSALRQQGILELLETLHLTLPRREDSSEAFAARVFKVFHDSANNRVSFIKITGGSLKVKEEVSYRGHRDKVHEIRFYQGKDYQTAASAETGDIVGITGLTHALPGMGLGNCPDLPSPRLRPALRAAVLPGKITHDQIMSCLRRLEAQDPLLAVAYEPALGEISVGVMGKIQLEILEELLRERHGLDVAFGACSIVYRETVAKPVMGYGHYEPLRHYAEVHLRLEPNPGGGIAFASECHTDRLPSQFQNLIRHHLLERDHRGILTGSSLTDVRFVLTDGAHHLKHTEGGDFREASWRAVRQGLEKAESVLLEPFYSFSIDVGTDSMGRVLSDITRLHGEFEAPITTGDRTSISGKGPVETFLEYPSELLSFTKGTGAISMQFLGYFPSHDPQRVIEEMGYEKDRDLENPSSSVFCAKGAGYEVKWREAESHMHLL